MSTFTRVLARRGLAASSVVCLGLALAAPSASGVTPAQRAKCVSKGYRVVYHYSQGGIFQTARGVENGRGGYYVCLYRYGVRHTIGSTAPKHFSFAGHYYAYSQPAANEEGGDVFAATVIVLDLNTSRAARKFVHVAAAAQAGQETGPSTEKAGDDPVVDLVATTHGAAAWIARPVAGSSDHQVLAADGDGIGAPARLLDSGAIDLRSLRRSGSADVRWVNAGQEKTARLAGP